MKRLLSIALIAAVPSFAFAGSDETQAAAKRSQCVVNNGRMVVTRYAQFKYQGYTKKHSFQVDCQVSLQKKSSHKSWYKVDTNQQNAQISWKPNGENRELLLIKCASNDPLISGQQYNYTKEQVPTETVMFERTLELKDGGPTQLAVLPALASQNVNVKGADQQLDFIQLQGRRISKDKFQLDLMAYPKNLELNAQEPHYSQSVSPDLLAQIPLDQADTVKCTDLQLGQAQGQWGSDGKVISQSEEL